MSTLDQFIKKAKKIHGERYDYSRVVYRGNKQTVEIACLEHGTFKQQALTHIQGSGCPECSEIQRKEKFRETVIKRSGSLAENYPSIAKEWHPTKNGDLTPDKVAAGSNKRVWWKCGEGPDHEWQAIVNDRAGKAKSSCPCCAGQKVSVTNSLATRFPSVAAQWHPTKNGDLTPDKVAAGSNKRVWWKCDEGPDHEWQATVNSRTGKQKSSCPCCAGKKISVTNSLATRFPSVAAQWHPTKNGDLTPDKVTAGSRTKVWWKCDEGPD